LNIVMRGLDPRIHHTFTNLEVAVGSVRVDTDIVNPSRALIGSFHWPHPGASAVLDGRVANPRAYGVQPAPEKSVRRFTPMSRNKSVAIS
jgi:hypothetical protein